MYIFFFFSHSGSATNRQHLAVDPSGVLAAQKGHDAGYVVRGADAAEGRPRRGRLAIYIKLASSHRRDDDVDKSRKTHPVDFFVGHRGFVGDVLARGLDVHVRFDPTGSDAVDGDFLRAEVFVV